MAYEELLEHGIELLQPLGRVRARRMFGGHGLYVDELFIALVAFDSLYLKVDASTRAAFEAAGCQPFVYDRQRQAVALGYWSAPPDALESSALMLPWARLALQAALRAQAAKVAKAAKTAKTLKPRKAKAAPLAGAPGARRRARRAP